MKVKLGRPRRRGRPKGALDRRRVREALDLVLEAIQKKRLVLTVK